MARGLLSLESVSKVYGRGEAAVDAVRDVSFGVEAGTPLNIKSAAAAAADTTSQTPVEHEAATAQNTATATPPRATGSGAGSGGTEVSAPESPSVPAAAVEEAPGRVLKAGRTLTVAKGDVFAVKGGEEKLVATMLATLMTVRERGLED